MEEEIAIAGWPDGRMIASIDTLSARFSVCKQVAREAARILELRGSCHIRRGPGGGLVVSCPRLGRTASILATYAVTNHATVADVRLVRARLDPAALGIAARRISREALQALRARLAGWRACTDPHLSDVLRAHYILREAVAALTDNPALLLLARCLTILSADVGRTIVATELLGAIETYERHVLDALDGAGDAFQRARMTAAHIDEAIASLVGAQTKLNAMVRIDSVDRTDPHQPQAIRIARQLSNDLRTRDWGSDDRVGSEIELAEAYGAGQLTIRQTIRLLAEFGVAETRPGKCNGVYVVRAMPIGAASKMGVAYMSARRLTAPQLAAARRAVGAPEPRDGFLLRTFDRILSDQEAFMASCGAPLTGAAPCAPAPDRR